ncbi:MAG TPA: hypothetical protein VGI83_09480, partial [Gemmatimonadales bacterium]
MRHALASSLVAPLAEAAANVAWRQWAELGTMASHTRRAQSVVDPEALVLLSLTLMDRERRLGDTLLQWVTEGGVHFLSVQRMRNMMIHYPEWTRPALAAFAAAAHQAGDSRWKGRFFGAPHGTIGSRRKVADLNLDLVSDPTLMLRLRRALGIGIRSDIFAYLLGVRGTHVTNRVLSHYVHYTPLATKRAADELAAARLIEATTSDHPRTYGAKNLHDWVRALELVGDAPPRWRYWHEVFTFVGALLAWERASAGRTMTPFAAGTLVSEILEQHREAFGRNGLPVDFRPKNTAPGEGAAQHLRTMAGWMT